MKNLFGNAGKTGKLAFAGFATSFLAAPNTFDTFIQIVKSTFVDMFMPLLESVASLILTVYRWVLTIIDFCFIIIKQMGGLNTDFSSLDSIIEGDIVFQFIFNETVVDLIKGLFGLAIVVIIVLGIIAIIKSEFSAVADTKNSGEIKNDKGEIWKRIIESVFLLVLVPIVFIGSMILSNAVLQTLLNATTYRNNMSLGAQIFVAGTYDANAYRLYAESNQKIPITYNFSQINDYSAVTEWDTTGTVAQIADVLSKYKQADEWTQGFATFEMFYLDTFFNMDTIDYYQHNDANNAYNMAYDTGIKTYKYEYYVNADLQDYLMKFSETVHILSAEEVYRSCQDVGVQLNMVSRGVEGSGEVITFHVNYADGKDQAIEYNHVIGSKDEAYGAVFLMCIEKEIEIEGQTVYYYEPITANNSDFESDYLENGNQYVVAKGFFDGGEFPTAIQKYGGKVSFYREKLNIPTLGTFLPHISYELPAGTTEEPVTHILKSAVELFTGINVSDFIPYIYFDIDMTCLFGKSRNVISTLDTSSYYLDYSFTAPGVYTEFVYYKIFINFLVLVVAAGLIVGKVVNAFFGLLKRAVDIMFLYLVYPAAVATIPLYEKSSFGNWVKQMTSKVLSLYGLMIGINLALLLIPLSTGLKLFTAQDLQNTIFGFMPGISAQYINVLFQILFTLVGITFIFNTSKIVQEFVAKGSDIVADGKKLTDEVKKVFEKAGKVASGAILLDSVKNITGYVDPATGQYHAGWIPGSSFIGMHNQSAETKYGKQQNKETAEATREQTKQQMQQEVQKAKQKKQEEKAQKEQAKANKSGGKTK